MSKIIHFRKMHGLGNDFVVIDTRHTAPFKPSTTQIQHIANRRWGVGCDQLIVLEASAKADGFMRIFNNDGTQAQACGNATRCIAAIFAQEGIEKPRIETLRGILKVEAVEQNLFRVDMGAPIFNPAHIPVKATDPFNLPPLIEQFAAPVSLGMGNPHCVFFVNPSQMDDIDDLVLQNYGQTIENHAIFPEKTNVHFVSIVDNNTIRQRVFERGAGITGASGSGACAGAVAALKMGKVQGKIDVQLDSGSLWIEWAGGDNDAVFMTGAWSESYRGTLDLGNIAAQEEIQND